MSFVEQRIKSILTNNQIEFEETEHEAVYTSQKAARVIGLESEEAGVKSLIFLFRVFQLKLLLWYCLYSTLNADSIHSAEYVAFY